MNDPEHCVHCGALRVADSRRPWVEIESHIKPLEPRWATLEGAAIYSGLSRSHLYRVLESGVVRTAMVKLKPENRRGRRLIDLRSLDAWIESWVSAYGSDSHR